MTVWDKLADYRSQTAGRSILGLFDDADRFDGFSASAGDMVFDFSKTGIDSTALGLLLELAEDADLAVRRAAMFSGQRINETENRAVLHTALRNPDHPVLVESKDVSIGVRDTLSRMEQFAHEVRGSAIRDVVNIGIGGSDLGPAMAVQALGPFADGPRCHFVSNVDGAHVHDTLQLLDPGQTLVIVASKTFSTIETMTNAATARDWMIRGGGNPALQFAALSSNPAATGEWGIPPERVFGFEDWVGGRYSVWGPIGLSLMIAIGPAHFREFLNGGAEIDRHFQGAPLRRNLPVLLALVGIWHHQICGYPTRAVLPYDQRLARLPAYLQQLEMESNGKRVAMDGSDLQRPSGPIVWGEPGTNGQHAFFQLIHQGTGVVPCEFLVAADGHEPELAHHHGLLLANCIAQSEALLRGRDIETARKLMAAHGFTGAELERQARHRVFPGNRPSTTLIYPKLDPATLGALIALYEHRVFVEGVILGINSFDQWGVELGKELATALGPLLAGEAPPEGKDGSTIGLLEFARKWRRKGNGSRP